MSLNIFLRKTEHTFEFQIIDLLIENNFQTTPPPLLFGPPRLLIFRSSVEPPLASFLLRLSLLFGIGEKQKTSRPCFCFIYYISTNYFTKHYPEESMEGRLSPSLPVIYNFGR